MKYLEKTFKERCKKQLSPLGFKPYRNNFYRVINDIFQSLSLHQSINGRECTVEFCAFPLCYGKHIDKSFCGFLHLKKFENNATWFEFDREDFTSIDNCINSMFEYIERYLIPFFESADTAGNAYRAYNDYGFRHLDYQMFCMAIKEGWYNKGIEHLLAMKNQIESAYKRNIECFGDDLDNDYHMQIKDELNSIQYQIKMLSQPNLQYIENFILENERIALKNLGIK